MKFQIEIPKTLKGSFTRPGETYESLQKKPTNTANKYPNPDDNSVERNHSRRHELKEITMSNQTQPPTAAAHNTATNKG